MVIDNEIATGLFVGMAPATGVVAGLGDDALSKPLLGWDPVQGDAYHWAPAGSTGGGGTRLHRFDRPITVTGAGTFSGALTIGGNLSFSGVDPRVSFAANYYIKLTSASGIIDFVSNTVTAISIANNGSTVTVPGLLAASGNLLISRANPELGLRDSGSAANAKHWIIAASGGTVALQTRDDAGAFGTTAMSVVRSGAGSITSFNFYAPLLPGSDNSLDLGSASFRWRHLFISGNITADGTGGINSFAAQTDVNALLRVTRTSQQFSLRYDISKRLDFLVDVNGISTLTSALTGVIAFAGTAGSGSSYMRLMNGTGGVAHLNWQIAKSDQVAQALEFTPSTANDGTTFTLPTLLLMAGGTTPVRIGGAGGTYGMIAFNALLNTATGMGIFARINATEGLYYNTPTGTLHRWTVNGSAVLSMDNTSAYLENGQYFSAKRNTSGSIIPLLGFETGTDNLKTVLAGDWLYKDTGSGTLFSFLQNGQFRAHGSGGFAIGTLAGVGRITFGSSAAGTFSFINAGGANADVRTGLIYPDVDNAYDLGVSGTFRFRSLYLSQNITFGGQLIGTVMGTTSNGIPLELRNGADPVATLAPSLTTFPGSITWGNGGYASSFGHDGTAAYWTHNTNIRGIQFRPNGTTCFSITLSGSVIQSTSGYALSAQHSNGAANPTIENWSKATSGDNLFLNFFTEGGSGTLRGSIDFNRGGGVVRYNTTSDGTLKNILGDADPAESLAILRGTRLRSFAWKDDDRQKPQIGPIAQELYEIFKGAVTVGGMQKSARSEDGKEIDVYQPWSVDKTAFAWHLVAGWQDHDDRLAKIERALAARDIPID